MLTIVDIWNAALVLLGADPLITTDDTSGNAAKCRAVWPMVRDAVLRAYPWNCARARATLTPLASAPAWGASYRYTLPPDCLRVLMLDGDPREREPWSVEGREIVTSRGPVLSIAYTRRVETAADYDASLVELLTVTLASRLAFPITSNEATARQMLAQAQQLLAPLARQVDAQEGTSQTQVVIGDDWTSARW